MIDKYYLYRMVLNHPSVLSGIDLNPQPDALGAPYDSSEEQYEILVGAMELYCYDVIGSLHTLEGNDAAELTRQTVSIMRTLSHEWNSVESSIRYGNKTCQQAMAFALGVCISDDGSVIPINSPEYPSADQEFQEEESFEMEQN